MALELDQGLTPTLFLSSGCQRDTHRVSWGSGSTLWAWEYVYGYFPSPG